MKLSNVLIVLVVLAVVGVVSVVFINNNSVDETEKMIAEETMMEEDKVDVMDDNSTVKEDSMEKPDAMMEKSQGYINYTEAEYDKNEGKKRVLYFHADWCPICRPLDKEFQQRIGEIPGEVVVFKVNYDKETALKTKYGVTYQHTFVLVDEDGNALKKWSGGQFDEVLSNII